MMILLDVQLRVLVRREEMNQQHLFQPCISDSFPPSSIRSNPASFYATELLMGFPWFDNRLRGARSLTDTLPQFDCSAVSQNIDRVQFRNTAENELQSVGQSMQMMGVRIHACFVLNLFEYRLNESTCRFNRKRFHQENQTPIKQEFNGLRIFMRSLLKRLIALEVQRVCGLNFFFAELNS